MDFKQTLTDMLGLKPDATTETIETEVSTFMSNTNKLTSDNADYKNRIIELEKANESFTNREKKMVADQVDHDLVEFSSVISDKEAVKAQLLANREVTVKFLRGLKKPDSGIITKPLHNRANAGTPGPISGDGQPVLSEVEVAKLRNRTSAIMAESKVPFTRAWNMAKTEFDRSRTIAA